jgi:hypothetical protein
MRAISPHVRSHGILTGGVLALVILGLVAFAFGVRRLDSDITAWDGMGLSFADRL